MLVYKTVVSISLLLLHLESKLYEKRFMLLYVCVYQLVNSYLVPLWPGCLFLSLTKSEVNPMKDFFC